MSSRLSGATGALLRRVGKSRYPVKTPAGPSVPQMMGADRVLDDLTPLAQDVLEKRFAHEISIRISGMPAFKRAMKDAKKRGWSR